MEHMQVTKNPPKPRCIDNDNHIEKLVNSVAKVMVEAFENLTIEDVNMFQLGYNKAVDDFVNKIKDGLNRESTKIEVSDVDGFALLYADCDIEEFVDNLAAELKSGGNVNENV